MFNIINHTVEIIGRMWRVTEPGSEQGGLGGHGLGGSWSGHEPAVSQIWAETLSRALQAAHWSSVAVQADLQSPSWHCSVPAKKYTTASDGKWKHDQRTFPKGGGGGAIRTELMCTKSKSSAAGMSHSREGILGYGGMSVLGLGGDRELHTHHVNEESAHIQSPPQSLALSHNS